MEPFFNKIKNINVISILLVAIALILEISQNAITYNHSYNSGLFNKAPGIIGFIPVLGCFGLQIISLIILLVMFFQFMRRKYYLRMSVNFISFLAIVLIMYIVQIAGIDAFADGFKKWTAQNVDNSDVEEIRAWMKTAEIVKENPWDSKIEIERERWSEAIKKIKPRYVFIDEDDNGARYVILARGSGFFHWDSVIGDENVKNPYDFGYPYEYKFYYLSPGVYLTIY